MEEMFKKIYTTPPEKKEDFEKNQHHMDSLSSLLSQWNSELKWFFTWTNIDFIWIYILQVLPGSHKAGRIEHKFVAGQTGADLERVEHLKKVFPLTYMEMEPGE